MSSRLLLLEVVVLELAVDVVDRLDVGLLADVGRRRGCGAGMLLERGDYVVIPVGGGGTSVISMARTGWQPAGGQRPSSKTQMTSDSGRAALGASRPAQPSRHRVSPTSWNGGQVRRDGRGRGQPDGGEPLAAAEGGELGLDLPDVVVVRDRARRWKSPLGEEAIPLGGRGGRLIGEV